MSDDNFVCLSTPLLGRVSTGPVTSPVRTTPPTGWRTAYSVWNKRSISGLRSARVILVEWWSNCLLILAASPPSDCLPRRVRRHGAPGKKQFSLLEYTHTRAGRVTRSALRWWQVHKKMHRNENVNKWLHGQFKIPFHSARRVTRRHQVCERAYDTHTHCQPVHQKCVDYFALLFIFPFHSGRRFNDTAVRLMERACQLFLSCSHRILNWALQFSVFVWWQKASAWLQRRI